MRFIPVNDIHLPFSDEAPNSECGINPSPSMVDAMCGDARILRAASQQGVAKRDQFGGMAARE